MRQDPERKNWTISDGEIVGRVLRIVRDRGFGFVHAGDTDYFLHKDDYDGDFAKLEEGQDIRFKPAQAPKGPRCVDAVKARL